MSALEYLPLKPSWEKVVKIPQTSEDWLKKYGLKTNKLSWSQVASRLGFKKKSSHVTSLHQSVDSRYGDGLFTQYTTSPDQIYQLTADLKKIEYIEHQLMSIVAKLKARLKWLQSGSRLRCGVVLEKRPVLVVTSTAKHAEVMSSLVSSVVREQCVHCHSFNVITCYGAVYRWRNNMATPSLETIQSSVEWLAERGRTAPPGRGQASSSPLREALTIALDQQEADCVFLVAYDTVCLEGYPELVTMVKKFPLPLNVVAINCKLPDTLEKMKQLSLLAHGRCHSYQMNSDNGPTLSQRDVLLLEQEIDAAKTALAEVQALRMDVKEQTSADNTERTTILLDPRGEEFMTSTEWLTRHGIQAKKLTFEDLVGSLAFRHCDGVLRNASTTNLASEVSLISKYEMVHAQYCSGFIHLRWRDGSVVHVNLTKPLADDFKQQIERAIEKYRQRISWLRQGSRELFGTLLEDSVVMVLDTSASMKLHLPLVKHKFHQLVREQLSHKKQFTVVQCTSSVRSWRARLVPVNTQTLEQAIQWVESLQPEGSSNVMDVLQLATTIPGAQGIYLLTDGRPDQAPTTILAARQSWPSVPIHTISFNCADSGANHFLARLSADSGGRYHYFADDVEDTAGPVPYKSVDVQVLFDEIEMGKRELVRVQQLEVECCNLVDKRVMERDTAQLNISPENVDGRTQFEGGSEVSVGTTRKSKTLLPSHKWLKKNNLSAKGLTLVDALGPSAVPHTPTKPLPHSGKTVYGKVLREVLPVSHVTSEGRVTLIHPSEPDLRSFQDKLSTQVEVYRKRLDHLVREALPEGDYKELCRDVDSSKGSSDSEQEFEDLVYFKHKKLVLQKLAKLDWPRPKGDFMLLEKEVVEGGRIADYLGALLQKSKETEDWSDDSSVCTVSTRSQASLALTESSVSSGSHSTVSRRSSHKRDSPSTVASGRSVLRKGASVVAQDGTDGFFYQGRITASKRGRTRVTVEFTDGQEQEMEADYVLGVGGARPCPVLKVGDCVMVRVRSRHSAHWKSHDTPCDMYIPCVVLKAPPMPHLSTAFYSSLAYNGRKVMCTRRHLVAISNKQYEMFTDAILSKQKQKGHQICSEGEGNEPSQEPLLDMSEQLVSLKETLINGGEDLHEGKSQLDVSSPVPTSSLPAPPTTRQPTPPTVHQSTPPTTQQPTPPTSQPLSPPPTPIQVPPSTTEAYVQVTELCNRASSPVRTFSSVAVNTVSIEEKCTFTGPFTESVSTNTEWIEETLPRPPDTTSTELSQSHKPSEHTKPAELSTECSVEPTVQHPVEDTVQHPVEDTVQHPVEDTVDVAGDSEFLPPRSSTPTNPAHLSSIKADLMSSPVLAKWSTDGWYRRAMIVKDNGDSSYLVMDNQKDGDIAMKEDIIIICSEPTMVPVATGSHVITCHPKYPSCYGPAEVSAHMVDDQYAVLMSDGTSGKSTRNDMFIISERKYSQDALCIVAKQQEWIGQGVVARSEDGFFYRGTVKTYCDGCFLVVWLQDGSSEYVESDHVFGPAQKRRVIQPGDCVVAFKSTSDPLAAPGKILTQQGGYHEVLFCDGKREFGIPSHCCHWVSPQYYAECLSYILEQDQDQSSEEVSDSDTS